MLKNQAITALSGVFLAIFTERSLLKGRRVVIVPILEHSQLQTVMSVALFKNQK